MPVAANAPGARGELQTSAGRCDHLNADLRAFSVQATFRRVRRSATVINKSSVDERVASIRQSTVRYASDTTSTDTQSLTTTFEGIY